MYNWSVVEEEKEKRKEKRDTKEIYKYVTRCRDTKSYFNDERWEWKSIKEYRSILSLAGANRIFRRKYSRILVERGKIGSHLFFFFFGLFVAKIDPPFLRIIVPLFSQSTSDDEVSKSISSDRFFFFFFFSLNFYSGYIKAKGSIEKYTGGMQGIRENYRYYYYYDFVLNNHKCGREKNDIYLFNFAFDTGTSAPIIDLLDSRI